ncbi:bifunctional 3-(3-hydroxy-phenyl)propionate/3-hydroxycinnamic acid hydroxylase [Rhizobium sp. KVB221]|uniref:Bifunctional 3-(3-hydroxy-phenyl)propionate/3-hydroxycinnamic acid hydroxylase n=1 Tax=Rhizobium setariae TaxID=2801340 RepID=A0A937CP19_9HYPH|nr:bifunctional 3-(3-hydroxy-phenyl)propionate/3-hydroxycinnamic acid hydroxylase [Rhizobium setariae]MBL0371903.1 bifunctional 3-(3-hydroxy-phenyl)propionate/3-hydroxycinnamic acid hydroxylase [Rhizobium setariae]
MEVMAADVDYDVIQIGYGPVSKASALFLSRMGWKVGVFERWQEVYSLPRAVCIDHEIFRVLHAAGLGHIADSVTNDAPVYRWFNAEWKQLLAIDWAAGSISGGSEVNFVHQPSFEWAMDAEIKSRPGVDLNFNCEAVAISQTADRVTVTVRDTKSGATRKVTARYLLGIDGANSLVREQLGIGRTDLGFEADWLVIDFTLKDGLTARDLGIPECGQYCNPERPTTIVPGGIDNGRICRRWEFMRLPHETREEMLEEKKVWDLLSAWIKPDQGELVRHALYTFRSLVADKWQDGRIFLAGDAAHVMPPFMGQGMCAGLRDVWNLAWKLDRVMKGDADASLLETYEPERAPHATDVIKASIFLGSIICMPDAQKAAERDAAFLSSSAPPPPPFPILTKGLLEKDRDGNVVSPAGQLAPHGAVRYHGKTSRLDRVVLPGFNLFLSGAIKPSELTPAARSLCEAQGIEIVTVADRRLAGDDQIGDTQGQILTFMKERGLDAMLVRPDFYLFGGAAGASRVNAMLMEFDRQAQAHGFHPTRAMAISA